MARLPQPGSDSGTWGDILNDYLSQSHKTDGSLKDNSVTSSTLAPNSVTSTAIAGDAVTATQIADGTIQEAQLSTAVTTKLNAPATITDGSITATKLADSAVGTAKLQDNAITSAKIADGTIQASDIADGTLPKTKLSTSVQSTLDKADSALQSAPVTSVNTKTGAVTLAKSDIGLGNVDNTSDVNKPVSTATQAALDGKAALASPTFTGTPTVAGDAITTASQLTSYAPVSSAFPYSAGYSLANLKGLRRWSAMLGYASTATIPILAIGDSLTFGQGSDYVNGANGVQAAGAWPAILRRRLAALYGSPGEGYVTTGSSGNAPDSRITASGASTAQSTGIFGNGYTLLGTGQTVTIAVPSADVDGVAVKSLDIIFYWTPGMGVPTYTFNGGSSTALSITGSSSATYYITANVATNGAAGNLVLTGAASGNTAYLIGVVFRSAATRGVAVHRVAMCGQTTANLLGTASSMNLSAVQQARIQSGVYEWLTRKDTGVGVTNGSTTVTSARAASSDVGKPLIGPFGNAIPLGSVITAVTPGTSWTISKPAIATTSGLTVTVGQPGLAIIEFGINDWIGEASNGITPSVFAANLTTFATQLTGIGWSVLLAAPPQAPYNPGSPDPFSAYVAAMKGVAQANDHMTFWDATSVLGTATQMQADGLLQFAGSVHLTPLGYGVQGAALANLVTNIYSANSTT